SPSSSSEKLSALELSDEELGLFTAVVLVSADRSGMEDTASVEQLQETLLRALRALVLKTRPAETSRFTKLLLKLPDLRTLNNLHSEKLLSFPTWHCHGTVTATTGRGGHHPGAAALPVARRHEVGPVLPGVGGEPPNPVPPQCGR
uniref:NR LBD domain-containing protein n=1 Tax=Serinus canaria TaxID=9135 RepID=A0A8C9MXV3_SERCA